MNQPIMRAGDLKKALANIPDNMMIVPLLELSDGSFMLFALEEVSIHQGTPSRDDEGHPGFKFEAGGSATWAFVTMSCDGPEPKGLKGLPRDD